MGLPPARRHPRSAPDGPPVLRLHRRGHRSLQARGRQPPGDAVGPRARPLEESERHGLGQPARHVHPRDRRRDGPGQRGRDPGPATPHHPRPPARFDPGSAAHHGAAGLLRRAGELIRRRRGPAGRVRLSRRWNGRHQADDALVGRDRDPPRHHAVAPALRAPVPRLRPVDQPPGHQHQPAAVPSVAGRSPAPDRPVPPLRQGPVRRHSRRRPARLRPGRLHRDEPLPPRPGVRSKRAEHARRRRRPASATRRSTTSATA